jgi:hypothetical protein
VFVLDTNVFNEMGGYYPSRFPSFWAEFDKAAQDGTVKSVEEVMKELDRWNAASHIDTWVKSNKDVFSAPTEDELGFVAEIFKVKHFQALVGQKQILQGTPAADPFVIAAAKVGGACVVTQERWKPNSAKIPAVCKHFGLDCIDLEALMTHLGWRF